MGPHFTYTFKMVRMHTPGKGISRSALPYKVTPPSWLKVTPEEVCTLICRAAKKGSTPSQIGVMLRDSHGVARVKNVTGAKIRLVLIESRIHRLARHYKKARVLPPNFKYDS